MARLKRTASLTTLPPIDYGSYVDAEYRQSSPHVFTLRRIASVPSLPSVQKPYLGWKYTGTPSDRFCRDWLLWEDNYASRLRQDVGPDYIAGSRYSHLYPPSSLWTYYPTLDKYSRNSRYALADRADPLYWRRGVAGRRIAPTYYEKPVTYPYRSSWIQESLDTEKSLERYKRGLIGLDVHLQQYWLTPNTWQYRFSSFLQPYVPPVAFNTAPRHYMYGWEYR